MKKFFISSFEDLLTIQEICVRNDIPSSLVYIHNDEGDEVGASLEVADQIYFWNLEDAASV